MKYAFLLFAFLPNFLVASDPVFISGIFRQDTPNSGWYVIDDGFHTPQHIHSFTILSSWGLQVNYDVSPNQLFTVQADVDETLDAVGVRVGVSGGGGRSIMFFKKNAKITIDLSTLKIKKHVFFGDTISVTKYGSLYTVTHPSTSTFNESPIVSLKDCGRCMSVKILSETNNNFSFKIFDKNNLPISISTGSIVASRDNIYLHPSNIYGTNANIWFSARMGY